MKVFAIGLALAVVAGVGAAQAQNATARVTSTVAGVTGSASTGTGGTGSQPGNPFAALGQPLDVPTAGPGGAVPGGVGLRVGGKVIQLRGIVGVGNDSNNFRASAGVPF